MSHRKREFATDIVVGIHTPEDPTTTVVENQESEVFAVIGAI